VHESSVNSAGQMMVLLARVRAEEIPSFLNGLTDCILFVDRYLNRYFRLLKFYG